MSALEIAQAHFKALSLPREIEIPEWGGAFYVTPFNMGEKQKLLKVAGDDMEFQARTIIAKVCVDTEGTKAFTIENLPHIMQTFCPVVVQRVCFDIQKALSVEEAKGN